MGGPENFLLPQHTPFADDEFNQHRQCFGVFEGAQSERPITASERPAIEREADWVASVIGKQHGLFGAGYQRQIVMSKFNQATAEGPTHLSALVNSVNEKLKIIGLSGLELDAAYRVDAPASGRNAAGEFAGSMPAGPLARSEVWIEDKVNNGTKDVLKGSVACTNTSNTEAPAVGSAAPKAEAPLAYLEIHPLHYGLRS